MIGSIFEVTDTPSQENDVVTMLGITSGYPVYGIIVGDREEDNGEIPTEVYSNTGRCISREWWFYEDEICILEEI